MRILFFASLILFIYSFSQYQYQKKYSRPKNIAINKRIKINNRDDFFKDFKKEQKFDNNPVVESEELWSLTEEERQFRVNFLTALSDSNIERVKELWEVRPFRPSEENIMYYLSIAHDYELTKFFYDEGYPVDDLMNLLEHIELDKESYDG